MKKATETEFLEHINKYAKGHTVGKYNKKSYYNEHGQTIAVHLHDVLLNGYLEDRYYITTRKQMEKLNGVIK